MGRPAVMVHCNECNETLDAARAIVRNARRLAFVAANALSNGDVTRARATLSELNEALRGFDGGEDGGPSWARERSRTRLAAPRRGASAFRMSLT